MSRIGKVLGVAGVAGASLAALAAYSRGVVRRAERAFPPDGVLLDLESGAKLHVVESGAGESLVLIHGADGVARSFAETVSAKLATRFRVLAVDRPGHGYSTLPHGTKASVGLDAELIREGLRRLGVERPMVLGHSYGTLDAMRMELDHPGEISGLVLLAPVGAYPWRVPLGLLRIANVPVLGRVLTEALVVPLGGLVLTLTSRRAFGPQTVPDVYADYAKALYVRPSQFRALAAEYAGLREDVAALIPRLGGVTVPVEIVAGTNDRVLPPDVHARPLASALPEAEIVEVPGVGHELMWPRPDAVADAVERLEARVR